MSPERSLWSLSAQIDSDKSWYYLHLLCQTANGCKHFSCDSYFTAERSRILTAWDLRSSSPLKRGYSCNPHLMMANMELKFLHSLQCRAILMKCLMVLILFTEFGSLKISVATQKVSWFITSSKRFRFPRLRGESSLKRSSTYLRVKTDSVLNLYVWKSLWIFHSFSVTVHKWSELGLGATYSVGSMLRKSSKSLMESWAATSMVLSCSREIWLSLRRSWASSSEHNVSVSMLFFR